MTNRTTSDTMFREQVPLPPTGLGKLKWYGPGLLWMLSAVGTGSILFTPRVASAYQYDLLWVLLLVVFFMWVMIREMARFSVVTGQSMLEGMHTLSGPRNWAVWTIFVPQLCAAMVGIAGLSAIVGSALGSALPGSNTVYSVLIVVTCTAFTASGHYMKIERLSRIMAMILMLLAVVAAAVVFSDVQGVTDGLVPTVPADPDLYIILPWVGTILAGSMGIVWFGYWTATRGYGGGLIAEQSASDHVNAEPQASEARVQRLRAWLGVMTGAATLGVLGGLAVIFSFMVLGAELLSPAGVMPEGSDVAKDLSRLFSETWGVAGEIMMLAAIIIALGGSILANQDGWGRSFADMTLILLRGGQQSAKQVLAVRMLAWCQQRTRLPMFKRRSLKRLFIVVVTGLLPVLIILAFDNPVQIMSASGIIAAVHTPFIVLAALFVNCTRLPQALRPGLFYAMAMLASGLFYLGFAALYFLQLAGYV
ncbi:Nramp family divalent metal transporter [Pseudohongiella sp.]|uniref:Amino acid transporter transmembrane domain-containing protein n=3 Tax=root TaxID=1 RepID=A0A0F9V5A2_9ZZZZ|nr:Nramp family divalent metal transporter [Pseudohongiella sp.]